MTIYRRRRMHKLLIMALLLLALLLLTYQPVLAVEPVGGEHKVNGTTAGEQSQPAISVSLDGTTMRVWRGEEATGGIYDIFGTYIDGSNTVNTTINRRFEYPAVGLSWERGNGAIAWAEDNSTAIYGRSYSWPYLSYPGDYLVSQDTVHRKGAPAVSSDFRGGHSIVVWHSVGQDGYLGGIYGRTVNYGGVTGDEFQVNTYTAGTEVYPDVAMDYDGNFVVVWLSADGLGHEGIYAQRYDADLNRVGEDMEIVNFGDTGDVVVPFHGPAVAMDPAGNFIVAWTKLTGDADIYARRFYADGNPAGPAFRVNSYTTSYQRGVDVAMDRRGNAVIVWTSNGQDGSNLGIYGQLYDGTGQPVDNEFQVNEYTTGEQRDPAVAMSDVGRWTVIWTSIDQDGDLGDIYTRGFQHHFPTFVVNSTADPGDGLCTFDECTLREVLAEAVEAPGVETISFAIPGEGPHQITLNSDLLINSGVTIDGYTQPGAQPNTNTVEQGLNTELKIAVTGNIIQEHSTVTYKGLAIDGGIELRVSNATLEGNFIGTDIAGFEKRRGELYLLSGGGRWQIGGTTPAQRNLVVGSVYAGTYGSILAEGNLMGTDRTGTRIIGGGGLRGNEASLSIGGGDPQARNVVLGVTLGRSSGSISGNYFGVDVSGERPLASSGVNLVQTSGYSGSNNLFSTNVNGALVVENYTTTYDPTPAPSAPSGTYTISAMFTNHSTEDLPPLRYLITELSEGNVVLNALSGPGGIGGVVAMTDDVAAGATFTVDFAIGLQEHVPFNFFVDAYAIADRSIPIVTATDRGAGFAHETTDVDFQTTAGQDNQIYLPLISR